MDRAGPDQLTFVGDVQHARLWPQSRAAAALVSRGLEPARDDGRPVVFVDSADLAMAYVLEMFAPQQVLPEPGIHETAVIDPTTMIGEDVRIGPNCHLGPGVRLGRGCVLHSNVVILDRTTIGDECTLWPGTVIREQSVLGSRCVCHPQVTIGADGFGYRPSEDGTTLVKIPQIGTVEIGDDVEIGASSCIDRAKFAATVIGSGTKIDNLVQIGHNCRIGRSVIIAGHCGIAGSVTIEDGAVLGGFVAVRDHLTIGAGARLAGAAQLMHDVPAGETWAGSPAQPVRDTAEQIAMIRKLPELARQLRQLRRGQ